MFSIYVIQQFRTGATFLKRALKVALFSCSKLDLTGRKSAFITVEGTTLNYNCNMAKQTAVIFLWLKKRITIFNQVKLILVIGWVRALKSQLKRKSNFWSKTSSGWFLQRQPVKRLLLQFHWILQLALDLTTLPSLKNTVLIFPEIIFIQYFSVLVANLTTGDEKNRIFEVKSVVGFCRDSLLTFQLSIKKTLWVGIYKNKKLWQSKQANVYF